jgi:transcriptional regulator with XRE-family HTH domain
MVRGDRIRARRRAARMTQQELAARVGISQGFLSMVEAGAKDVSTTTLVAIAEALGTDPNDLLGIDANEPAAACQRF